MGAEGGCRIAGKHSFQRSSTTDQISLVGALGQRGIFFLSGESMVKARELLPARSGNVCVRAGPFDLTRRGACSSLRGKRLRSGLFFVAVAFVGSTIDALALKKTVMSRLMRGGRVVAPLWDAIAGT